MNIFKQMYTVRRYKGTSWDSGTAGIKEKSFWQ